MIKRFIFYFLLFTCTSVIGQEPPFILCNHRYKTEQLSAKAEFADGQDAMYRFIYRNLKWDCGDKSFEGTVIVSFTIDRVGNVWNVKIDQSVAPCLDNEVLKACQLMPRWIPANINGILVCSEVSIPVRFRLGWDERQQRK